MIVYRDLSTHMNLFSEKYINFILQDIKYKTNIIHQVINECNWKKKSIFHLITLKIFKIKKRLNVCHKVTGI